MEPDERTRLLDSNNRATPSDEPTEASPLVDETNETSETPTLRRWSRKASALVLTLAAIAVALGVTWSFLGSPPSHEPSSPEPETDGPTRVMIVGDSISQGWEGDYTWRYRIWEWFRQNNVNVNFVGPYTGTAHPDQQVAAGLSFFAPIPLSRADGTPPLATANFDGGYALDVDPEFLDGGNAHFSIWGQQAAQTVDLIGRQVRDYRPDILLIELGFNDMGWFVSGPDGTLNSMKGIVDNARAENPELKFAIANVPQRSKMDGREDLPVNTQEYNEKLRNAIPLWSFPNSPVELVKFQEAYSCDLRSCPAAYDGLHPNAQGEFEIAYAFSETLYEKFGIGQEPLSLPSQYPTRPCPTPAHPKAAPGQPSVEFSWRAVYGAMGYEVQTRKDDAAWPPDNSVMFTQSLHFGVWADHDDQLWRFRVRTTCGTSVKSGWTAVVSARPKGSS